MSDFETDFDVEEDTPVDFWERRTIGHIAARAVARAADMASTEGHLEASGVLAHLGTEMRQAS